MNISYPVCCSLTFMWAQKQRQSAVHKSRVIVPCKSCTSFSACNFQSLHLAIFFSFFAGARLAFFHAMASPTSLNRLYIMWGADGLILILGLQLQTISGMANDQWHSDGYVPSILVIKSSCYLLMVLDENDLAIYSMPCMPSKESTSSLHLANFLLGNKTRKEPFMATAGISYSTNAKVPNFFSVYQSWRQPRHLVVCDW